MDARDAIRVSIRPPRRCQKLSPAKSPYHAIPELDKRVLPTPPSSPNISAVLQNNSDNLPEVGELRMEAPGHGVLVNQRALLTSEVNVARAVFGRRLTIQYVPPKTTLTLPALCRNNVKPVDSCVGRGCWLPFSVRGFQRT